MSEFKEVNPTPIYLENGFTLRFLAKDEGGNERPLASKEHYKTFHKNCDRSLISVYDDLQPGEIVQLEEGLFVLDNELDLVNHCQLF